MCSKENHFHWHIYVSSSLNGLCVFEKVDLCEKIVYDVLYALVQAKCKQCRYNTFNGAKFQMLSCKPLIVDPIFIEEFNIYVYCSDKKIECDSLMSVY